MSTQCNENDIAQFLEKHPDFFKNHIGLLATMYLPNAHGGGTVSLAERQQAAQRDKIREIERNYTELLGIGIENAEIINKMHQLALSLLRAATLDETIEALISTLQHEFNIPMVTLKLWASTNEPHEVFSETDETIQAWLETLPEPYCGPQPDGGIANIMDSDAKSYAVVPLRNSQIIGMLAMASNEEKRFYPEMGTIFIERIGALVGAAIQKYII
jgi:uncharacterized protein YigA (DUF484 family)